MLNNFAPIKKKFVGVNQMPFMTKELNNEKVKAEERRFTKEKRRKPQALCKKGINMYLFWRRLKSGITKFEWEKCYR